MRRPTDPTPTFDPEKLRSLARLVRAWLQRQAQADADGASADDAQPQQPPRRRPRRRA